MFAEKITIPSDNTELKLIEVIPVSKINKEIVGVYEYTKAVHFLGATVTWTESNFEKAVKAGTIIVK